MRNDPFSTSIPGGESQTYNTSPFDTAWEQETPSRSWQIVPPIVTSGRLPIIPNDLTRSSGQARMQNQAPYLSAQANPNHMRPGPARNQVGSSYDQGETPVTSAVVWKSAQPGQRPDTSFSSGQSGNFPSLFSDSSAQRALRNTSLLPPTGQSFSSGQSEMPLVRRMYNSFAGEESGSISALSADSSALRALRESAAFPAESSREEQSLNRPAWQKERTTGWQRGVRPGLPPDDYISRPAARLSYPGLVGSWLTEKDSYFLPPFLQTGLAGLADGSILTLAPLFSVAFLTWRPLAAFAVGLTSALCISISIAISGMFSPLNDESENRFMQSILTGAQVFLSGLLETLPFLLPNMHIAVILALCVAGLELIAVAILLAHFFVTSLWYSLLQIVGGGLFVTLIAILIGRAL